MSKIDMYSSGHCPYCKQAEQLLARKGVKTLNKISIDENPEQKNAMIELTGRRTVPQIFIGGTHVGGYDDLVKLDRAGGLDALLAD
ncbi:glutaredoxin 3 [Permianibacter sp. IMCC34836]|uniref:glutaredoxin 3 n=1 Tax=Permianibacter fluminis TaxID=2738515 RepID=UPI001552F7FE|nr:glutaredoxin 3 [Permianibacter fluminis]NQD37991.1 glutaredoxin 3 [Permianibacter fluminis]